ncbi:contact-dependent growth inhibition system immunity protein [Streptomyces sp. NBC_01446]|uniref:Contact-dependent growth inhibition system immunity protein n=1 Tax=Streptomyces sp. NBC_00119 TaxID=2975659 RepID=A0AAU1UIT0_9ACTN|nr:contact-dependent growth inhibition system immunity protein [Streptomyces sp. NBC_01446]MCX4647333.1 contact-dependent growth inhibition system immunity protein [Streptomyces sp. NBC_01446]
MDHIRFPEVHDLLHAYASAGYVFTDTPQAAGDALQSYIRQAVRTPGLLDTVIAEIDDLLTVDLVSDEIADEVDTLPHIKPSADRTVEQCLALARDHLDRIRRGGDYEHAENPRTDREWAKPFPELQALLGGYFHQDFSRFYACHRAALDDYLDANGPETIGEAAKEIGSFLTSVEDDSELDQAAQILGLQVYPPEDVPLRRWLQDIQGTPQHHPRSQPIRISYSPPRLTSRNGGSDRTAAVASIVRRLQFPATAH